MPTQGFVCGYVSIPLKDEDNPSIMMQDIKEFIAREYGPDSHGEEYFTLLGFDVKPKSLVVKFEKVDWSDYEDGGRGLKRDLKDAFSCLPYPFSVEIEYE